MSDKILKLSQAQTLYQDLRGRIDALPTDSDIPEVPVQDVQMNGTSILDAQGVANLPLASSSRFGVIKVGSGLQIYNNSLLTAKAPTSTVKAGIGQNMVIVPYNQHESVFYGLSKLAGVDLASGSDTIGVYPDSSKAAIQNLLGITNLISTEESSTATAAHALNSTFMMNGKLHRATAAIAIGDAVEVGTNCEVVKADEVFVKKTDIANGSNPGIIKINPEYGIGILNGFLTLNQASADNIKAGNNSTKAVSAYRQHEAVFYGLSKAAGIDLANETVTVGTYPETSKTAIRSLIGAAAASSAVTDVQVSGTSIVSSNIANIPLASDNNYGLVIGSTDYGVRAAGGYLFINSASEFEIKGGAHSNRPVVPYLQHQAVYYGLSKLAGVDLASETVILGTYPETSKTAIRSLIGAGEPLDVQINGTSIVSSGVANIPLATSSDVGVIKPGQTMQVYSSGAIDFRAVGASEVKAGTTYLRALTPERQHASVFYGLAKAAGADMASSDNAVGTYTTTAKTAIQTMLGVENGVTFVETVSGTTPVIIGEPNVRYKCGEVSTISITPPAAGTIDVTFTSGSTPAVLTLPNTVIFPEWVDLTTLQADTKYEIMIVDGEFGGVMTWPI